MVRIITFSVGFIIQIIEVVFSVLGLIAAVIGASIALALCIGMIGGVVLIFSFLLALFG